jgi:hypothetical protein
MDTIVIDNWYENPDEIREMALSNFRERCLDGDLGDGYVRLFPGNRTFTNVDNLNDNLVKFEKTLNKKINQKRWVFNNAVNISVCDFPETCVYDFEENGFRLKETGQYINIEAKSNGEFQYITEECTSWVHRDVGNMIAAVVYLTPNPPVHSGTGMYEHKKTKQRRFNSETTKLTREEYFVEDDWFLIEEIENVYNRCIIWDPQKFHKCVGTFGTDVNNSRLTQVFFFDLE